MSTTEAGSGRRDIPPAGGAFSGPMDEGARAPMAPIKSIHRPRTPDLGRDLNRIRALPDTTNHTLPSRQWPSDTVVATSSVAMDPAESDQQDIVNPLLRNSSSIPDMLAVQRHGAAAVADLTEAIEDRLTDGFQALLQGQPERLFSDVDPSATDLVDEINPAMVNTNDPIMAHRLAQHYGAASAADIDRITQQKINRGFRLVIKEGVPERLFTGEGATSATATTPSTIEHARTRDRISDDEFIAGFAEAEPQLYTLALMLMRNPTDAADLVAEARELAFRSRDSFAKGTSFKAWVSRITQNRGISHHRDRARHRGADVPTTDGEVPDAHVMWAARQRDIGDAVADQDFLRHIVDEARAKGATVASLLAAYMVDADQASYEEIGEDTNVKLGTVRSRVHRGRKALRDAAETMSSGTEG